eukprot:4788516-Pyramimonas_sp.AAC.1
MLWNAIHRPIPLTAPPVPFPPAHHEDTNAVRHERMGDRLRQLLPELTLINLFIRRNPDVHALGVRPITIRQERE